jgi:hypothetical protein
MINRSRSTGIVATLCAFMSLTLAVLCAPAAHAGIHHGAASVAPAMCPQAVDNYCAASTTYISDAGWIDTNFVYDYSQSGQCVSPCSGANLASLTSNFYKANANMPFATFAVGSEIPSKLRPISSWNADHFGGTDPCTYMTTGAPFGQGKYLACGGTAATAGTVETIQGYDFTNGGVDCVTVDAKDAGTFTQGISFVWINDYFGANSQCLVGDGVGTPNQGTIPAFIYYEKSIGQTAATWYFHNITANGNFKTAGSQDLGQMIFFHDNRLNIGQSGALLGKYMDYSYIVGMGHDLFIGGTGAGTTIVATAVGDTCLSGRNDCHGEVEEDIQPLSLRNVNYSGSLVYMSSTYVSDPLAAIDLDWTTAFYFSNGVENGAAYGTITNNNNIVWENGQQCTNAGPYSPTNVCSGGSQIFGTVLFSVQNPPYVTTMHVHNNVVSHVGGVAQGCYKNYASFFTTMVGVVNGAGLNITRPDNTYQFSYGGSFVSTLWPGLLIYDTNTGDGFPTTTIASNGTYSNLTSFTGTVNSSTSLTTAAGVTLVNGSFVSLPVSQISFASGSISGGSAGNWTFGSSNLPTGSQTLLATNNTTGCNPIYNQGCGTLNLSVNTGLSSKTITGTFGTQASITNPDFGADNYDIGGAGNPGALMMSFGTLPWSGVSGSGAVACLH